MTKENFCKQLTEITKIYDESEKLEDGINKLFKGSKLTQDSQIFFCHTTEIAVKAVGQLIMRFFDDGDVHDAEGFAWDILNKNDLTGGIFNFKEMCEPKKLDNNYFTGYCYDKLSEFYCGKHQKDDQKRQSR